MIDKEALKRYNDWQKNKPNHLTDNEVLNILGSLWSLHDALRLLSSYELATICLIHEIQVLRSIAFHRNLKLDR